MANFKRIQNIKASKPFKNNENKVKVESDWLGHLKYIMRNRLRSLLTVTVQYK